jgi:hypothetical protein
MCGPLGWDVKRRRVGVSVDKQAERYLLWFMFENFKVQCSAALVI